MITAILLAAGSGRRMAGEVADKTLVPLNGKPALCYSLQAFAASELIDECRIVYRDEAQRTRIAAILEQAQWEQLKIKTVSGGQERQDSVMRALNTVDDRCEYVFIHDCARPCVTATAIKALHQAVLRAPSAALAHPITDTIKRIPDPDTLQSVQLEDLDRQRLWAMETPQAFQFARILQAYQKVSREKLNITDDTAATASIGLPTTLVPNPTPNPKLTTPDDLTYIECLIASPPLPSDELSRAATPRPNSNS